MEGTSETLEDDGQFIEGNQSVEENETKVEHHEMDEEQMVEVHEGEVLEEIVETEELYDENGELVTYQDVVVYHDEMGEELNAPYVDVAEIEGKLHYIITDTDGSSRVITEEEFEALRREEGMDELKQEEKKVLLDQVQKTEPEPHIVQSKQVRGRTRVVMQDDEGAGPSGTSRYSKPPRQRERFAYEPAHVDQTDAVANDFEDCLPSYLRDKFAQCLSRTNQKRGATEEYRDLINKGMGVDGASSSAVDVEEEVVFVPESSYIDEHGRIARMEEVGDPLEGKILLPRGKQRTNLSSLARVEIEKTSPSKRGRKVAAYRTHAELDRGRKFETLQDRLSKPRLYNPLDHQQNVRDTSSIASAKMMMVSPRMVEYGHNKGDPDLSSLHIRFKCPECEDGSATIEQLCDHMSSVHEAPTYIRTTEGCLESDFESFLINVEREGLTEEDEVGRVHKKKARIGSQFFKCNFWSKSRTTPYAEMIEVSQAQLIGDIEPTCPAFILKLKDNYDAANGIRLKHCSHHVHHDEHLGFRVPIPVKRRLFELSFKRLPIPVILAIIQADSEQYASPNTKIGRRLKTLTEDDVSNLLLAIHSTMNSHQRSFEENEKRINIIEIEENGSKGDLMIETIKGEGGEEVLGDEGVVKQEVGPEEVEEGHENNGQEKNGQDAPVLEREDGVVEEEVHQEQVVEEHVVDGGQVYEEIIHEETVVEEQVIDEMTMEHLHEITGYDPTNDQDVLLDELSEGELRFLEDFEQTHNVRLTEGQREERLKIKMKHMVKLVLDAFQELDAFTLNVNFVDHKCQTLIQNRDYSTLLLDTTCELIAETQAPCDVKAVKEELMERVRSKEKIYYTSEKTGCGRRKATGVYEEDYDDLEHPNEADINEDIFNRIRQSELQNVGRNVGINMSGSFTIPEQQHVEEHQLKHHDDHKDENGREKTVLEALSKRVKWFPKSRKRNVDEQQQSTSDGTIIAPVKRKRMTKREKEQMLAEEQERLTRKVHITTDDNVPIAISMGVDQEVEIETESQENDLQHFEEVVVDTIGEEVVIEQEPSTSASDPSIEIPEHEVKAEEPIKVTRTGRVVKPKKWQE